MNDFVTASPLLRLVDVKKNYNLPGKKELEILKGINVEIYKGDCVIITGTSGSGKSTLLNLIGGIDRLSEGELYSCGYDFHTMKEKDFSIYRREKVGFIFQFHHLLRDFTALENLLLPAKIKGLPMREAQEKAKYLLKEIGLFDRRKHTPLQMSGGERQRIAIARALMNDSELILADEPTGNLDEENSDRVTSILFDLVEEFKRTLVFVTHDTRFLKSTRRHFHLSYGVLKEV